MKNLSHLSSFVKYHREKLGLTQEELAQKTGVGLRFIRDLEQDKTTLRMDKVNQVLSLFGYELKAERDSIDAYWVWKNYFNTAVKITLKNKEIIYGFIIGEIKDEEFKITAWRVVPNLYAKEYQKSNSKELERIIEHKSIDDIENQDNEQRR